MGPVEEDMDRHEAVNDEIDDSIFPEEEMDIEDWDEEE